MSLAGQQLNQLAAVSKGAIQVLQVVESANLTRITVSLETRDIKTEVGGITLRAREVFVLDVSSSYPFAPPLVNVNHTRWAGTAHVQWGKHLCIYAAPSVEWNPADGMRGLVQRLYLWLQNAAAGTLDPDGQPLHPPVAYASTDAGRIVIRPDLGSLAPWSMPTPSSAPAIVLAWCVQDGDRVDVVQWQTHLDCLDKVLAADFVPADAAGRPYFVAPCVLIHDQIGFEYPKTAAALAESLAHSGFETEELLLWLARAALVNSYIRGLHSTEEAKPELPNLFLLGTPSRRLEGTVLLAHISAWRLEALGSKIAKLLARTQFGELKEMAPDVMELAQEWLTFAKTAWMRVHEERPEVTRRRDAGSPAEWLRGKRVLVLGCGAIGAPIAEHCARAGVASLTVADNGVVSPGVLVRQPYSDADVGKSKAAALAERLSAIRRDLEVRPAIGNVVTEILAPGTPTPDYDLVIDATADVGVRTALERARALNRADWPNLVSLIIGHTAELGLVAVSPAGASGGGLDILRRVSIRARTEPDSREWSDVADDFYPVVPRTELFFPEPGCSEPTFVGSSSEVTALASSLLVGALKVLASTGANSAPSNDMTAIAVRLPGAGSAGTSVMSWPSDTVVPDAAGGDFEIRISQAALAEMRAEVRRGHRLRGDRVETGGMLIGTFDEAARIAHVDVAVGPPPDSALSEVYFRHGTEGTQDVLDHHRLRSGAALGFMGIWHTHPFGVASPSLTDEFGMAEILDFSGTGRRALMVIAGGRSTDWFGWRESGEDPQLYARVVEAGAPAPLPSGGIPFALDTLFFPGGYGYRPRAQPAQRPPRGSGRKNS